MWSMLGKSRTTMNCWANEKRNNLILLAYFFPLFPLKWHLTKLLNPVFPIKAAIITLTMVTSTRAFGSIAVRNRALPSVKLGPMIRMK